MTDHTDIQGAMERLEFTANNLVAACGPDPKPENIPDFTPEQFAADLRTLLDRVKALEEAIQFNQLALKVLHRMCGAAGLKQGEQRAYQMIEDNRKLKVYRGEAQP